MTITAKGSLKMHLDYTAEFNDHLKKDHLTSASHRI